MKKKEYMKPEQRVVALQHGTMLLSDSIHRLSTNMKDDGDDFIWGGGGDENAR